MWYEVAPNLFGIFLLPQIRTVKPDLFFTNTGANNIAIGYGAMDDVETVIIDGKKVVDNKKIVGVNEKTVIQDCYRAVKDELGKAPRWDYAQRNIWQIGQRSIKKLE